MLISVFTSTFNTGAAVIGRTYASLKAQTYTNWEWVVSDDSADTETFNYLRQLQSEDDRIKLYRIFPQTNGNIGEAKYRAAMMCSGELIAELDHDDELTRDALEELRKAALENRDAGFFYSDCAEIDAQRNSLTYGETYCNGYGTYYETEYDGKNYLVGKTPEINPVTIRHISGVPNHLRAWNRMFYLRIGGHNRSVKIADDYEMIVRTFLNTRMVHIPLMLYFQHYHDNNTQHARREEILTEVEKIARFYDTAIQSRFYFFEKIKPVVFDVLERKLRPKTEEEE